MLPLPGLPIPKDTEQVTQAHAFQTQTNQSRAYTVNSLLQGTLTHDHYPPALITQGQVPDTWAAPVPQSPLLLFKLASPRPVYLALPVAFHRNLNKGSCPQIPTVLSQTQRLLNPVLPCGALTEAPRLLFLGTCVEASFFMTVILIPACLTIPD